MGDLIRVILDSKIYYIGEVAYNLIIINVLVIVTSLGILTIGPSLKAGYQTVVDVVKGEEDGIIIRYLMYFKEDIIVTTGLTFILLLWAPVAMTLIEAEFNNGSILAKLMIAILISQIAMPIIGGFMVLTSSSNKERKKMIPTLREGIIHYSKNIYKYYILTAVFFCLIGVAVFMRVIMTIGISGSTLICYLLFSSRNLKSDGTNPISLLNVLEKTN